MNARASDIHSAIARADAFKLFWQRVQTVPGMSLHAALAAWEVIQNERPELYRPYVDIREIITYVGAAHGVLLRHIVGPMRVRQYADARHIAIWMVAELSNRRGSLIAKAFDRDPATVHCAIRRVQEAIKDDTPFGRSALRIMRSFLDHKAASGVTILWGGAEDEARAA